MKLKRERVIIMNIVLRKQLQMRAKDKKGFTLVEVIVVLVILAILMAIAIPALTGYIDKANERAVMAEAANVRTALQAIASDAYGSGTKVHGTVDIATVQVGGSTILAQVNKLTGATFTAGTSGQIRNVVYTDNTLTSFDYVDGNTTIQYTGGNLVVKPKP